MSRWDFFPILTLLTKRKKNWKFFSFYQKKNLPLLNSTLTGNLPSPSPQRGSFWEGWTFSIFFFCICHIDLKNFYCRQRISMTKKIVFWWKTKNDKKFGFEILKSPKKTKKYFLVQKKVYLVNFSSISTLNRIFNFCPFFTLIP